MRYVLAELDLDQPLPSLESPGGASGGGVLVRIHDRPIAFFMTDLPKGGINTDQLRDLVEEHAGTAITAELLRQELVPKPAEQDFPAVTVAICTRDHPDLVRRAIQGVTNAALRAGIANGFEILVV